MKPTTLLVLGLFALMLVLYAGRERFQPEFLDKRQVQRTVSTEHSSHAQQTNHMDPSPTGLGAPSGMQTPFQVNAYTSYVPI